MNHPLRGPRILVVLNALEMDAPSRLTLPVIRELKKQNAEVAVAAWSRNGPLASSVREMNIEPEILNGSPARLRKLLKTFNADLAHFHLAKPIMVALPLTRWFSPKTRTVITNHGTHELAEKGRLRAAVSTCWFPKAAAVADAIINVSSYEESNLIALGISETRQKVIYNGIPQKFFEAQRDQSARSQLINDHFSEVDKTDLILIGCAGNLRKVKNHETLLDAIKAAGKDTNFALIIWGEGPERENLLTKIATLNLSDRVVLAGQSPHLEKLMPSLDMFIQPSLHESFGMALAEALACGIPSIAAHSGAMPEIIPPDFQQWLFPPNAADVLATKIVELAESPSGRVNYSTTARAWAVGHFTEQHMVSETLACYTSLLAGSRP